MSRTRLAGLSLALAIAGLAVGGPIAQADTQEEMARDLVPAQKPLYELGGIGPDSGAAVEVWVDRSERIYAVGQQLKVFVRPKQTSYVTVLNVGTSGKVAVIYPNFYQRDMQVRAGQTVSIPAEGSNWKIDVSGPTGIDVIKVIASREPLTLPELLKLSGASADQPTLSLGRSGEEVARDLIPQIKGPGAGSGILPGGVRSLLVRIVPRGAAAFPIGGTPHLAGTFGLSLRPERAVYKIGEAVRVAVSVQRDCHLTLVGLGSSGKAVSLFPNQFQRESFLRAGQTVIVPSPHAPFEFRAQGPAGVEGLLATCQGGTAMSSPSSAQGGFAAVVGDLASVTRDLTPTAVAPGANNDVERVSGSFLVIN